VATGADDDYWGGPNLPSIIKHCIMRSYVPIFLGKTSSIAGRAVVLDRYAGRGTYSDGTPGSAGMLLQWALDRQGVGGRTVEYVLRFFEKDKKSYEALQALVETYTSQGVNAVAEKADVVTRLPSVVAEAAESPLFLFVDPTGIGLPFDDLVQALNRSRSARGWPPTEALINLSWQAIRRIGGLITSEKRDATAEKALARLDRALGGDWWQEYFQAGVTDEAVEAVVEEFISRLSAPTGCFVASVPIRRDDHHRPLYSLVFASRNRQAEWYFGDAVAKCLDDGRKKLDELSGRLEISKTRAELEAIAQPDIESNLLRLLEQVGGYAVGDYPEQVFGDHWGIAGAAVVRKAIKALNQRGLTSSNGVTRCRVSLCVADRDASSCGLAEFSSRWRTRFSHLRGGS
jgi:three-Cys-motif partner protein